MPDSSLTAWPGSAYPLGANYDGPGTNFALFSEAAERLDLCLFDDAGPEIQQIMGHAGVSSEPVITFWRKLATGDDVG